MGKYFIFLVSLLIYSCNDKDVKFYIKSIDQNNIKINWYCYSLLSSYSPGNIEAIKNKEVYNVVSSHYLTDVILKQDTLILQVHSNKSPLEINYSAITNLNLKVIVDTTGKGWNDGTARISRLNDRKIDLKKPHTDDGYSEKESYQ